MKPVTTFTANPALDKSTGVPEIAPDRKLRCASAKFDPGGGGINVSRAILELGGRTRAVFPCGGAPGQRLRELLDREGVPVHAIEIESWTRENLMVFDESSGDQYRFVFPGASLTESDVEACVDLLATIHPAPDYLVISGSLPPGAPTDLYARLARRAHGNGVRVVIDASGDALAEAMGNGVFLCKPNFRELEELIGGELGTEDDVRRACRDLVDAGACVNLLLSLGAGGAWITTPDAQQRIPAPSVEARSKVGAGDSMVAATVLGLARGWSVPRAAAYGVSAGAAAVMTPRTELCRNADVEHLFAHVEAALSR